MKEVKTLVFALCEYCHLNGLGKTGLIDMCTKAAKELGQENQRGWCTVAECLPDRSVQSIHNFSRRKFNPHNYGGKWTDSEE